MTLADNLKAFFFFVIFSTLGALYGAEVDGKQPKVLHLSFHTGCVNELTAVSHELGLNLETWYIPDLSPGFLDGYSRGNVLYNMGHERAERIWNLHKEYFQTFDAIITSDTAPLARIFLQNGCEKPLIIWICNRFDYSDQASLDCEFPDPEYYQLFQSAAALPNVQVVAYTAFELTYALSKGVELGHQIITPCGFVGDNQESAIPHHIVKQDYFFLPPYHNETHFLDMVQLCRDMDIPCYRGRYHGPRDLKDFKAIIHLPYAWSNLALFENMALGIPYLIPSPAFFRELVQNGNYFFHPDVSALLAPGFLEQSEWYGPEQRSFFIYFDSWEDLQLKVNTLDFAGMRCAIKNHAREHRTQMIAKWKAIFDDFGLE